MSRESLSSWRLDHIRVTAFFASGKVASPADIFQEAFSIPAEVTINKGGFAEQSASGGTSIGRVTVQSVLNRIDFILAPLGSDQPGFHLMDDVPARFASLVEPTSRWLTTQESVITRLAVAGGGLLPSADRTGSYRALRDLIRVVSIDVDRFRDFQFHVNLPIQSASIPGLTINRMTVWAAIGVGAGFFGPNGPIAVRNELDFAHCQFDINTDAGSTQPIAANDVAALLQELSGSAQSILAGGLE